MKPKSAWSQNRSRSETRVEKPARLLDLRIHHATLILRNIEVNGPLSRAELARQTGLSQPTVSAIVEGLLQQGLVVEKGAGPSTGGRRPTLLSPGGEQAYVLATDLGGTRMKMGLVNLGGEVVAHQAVATPGSGREGNLKFDPDQVLAGVAQNLEGFLAGLEVPRERIVALGLGLPGVTDPLRGEVTLAPALGWANMPVARAMQDRFGLPVFVENDVNAAAMAEQRYGQGRRLRDFVFVALGTGIGAGLILDGRLHRGHANAAGEVGYLAVDREWIRASIATRAHQSEAFGCWESLSAAPAIERMARELLASKGTGPSSEADSWLEPQELTAQTVMQAAAEGDRVGQAVLDRLAENLALGLTNIVVLLDPEAIILGGGVSQAGDLLLNAVRERLARTSPFLPEILISELGEEAGLLGAAAVAVEGVLPDLVARGYREEPQQGR